MILRLIRQKYNPQSVLGELWMVDHWMGDQKLCDTLENRDKLIPALVYRVHVTQSPKFRRLLPILNNVPGRTGIRIHAGNQPQDSQGCILVGKRTGSLLTDSRKTEQMITQLLLSIDQSREEIRIDICEHGARSQEPGTRNQEQGAKNQEQGTRNKEPGTRSKEPGTRNQEQGARSQEPGT